MQKEILVVGTLGFDTVTNCRGRVDMVLGGSASYASVAASYFARTHLISIVGTDFSNGHFAPFKKRGVDTQGVKVEEGKTFFWAAEYDKDFKNAYTKVTDLNVFANFKPRILSSHKKCKYAFLGNIDPEIQLSLIKQMDGAKLITCDTMNYWINSNKKAVKKVIKNTDILFVNESEARMLTGEYNLIKAGKDILKLGAKHVIIKLGPNGAMFISPLGMAQLPPFLVENIYDTTGAGDTFGGAFTGYLASLPKWNTLYAIKNAMAVGGVMASFGIESFSINKLLELSQTKINSRLNKYKNGLRF
ncbi:Ribokinase family [Elusimicrobium minutum Pei191]|uniref:Ribokinase family n=1 Tax=Elusimicrobium minutum (strain Pei191) TaxID=445932 RepID=B2KBQ7_ELUMP|nr:PfkB family carbohydrate kinase [Elusimicrobium minutum]ACC97744.1 Ribokinase family [Elusimicrobium minutum Pei191]